jgi:hypothetical protein
MEFISIDMVLPVNQEIQLQLTNSSGLQIQSTTTKGQRGLNQLKINTTSLSAGLYHLRITSGDEEAVRAFIIR